MLYVNLSEVLRDLVKTKAKLKLIFSLHSFCIIGEAFPVGCRICFLCPSNNLQASLKCSL